MNDQAARPAPRQTQTDYKEHLGVPAWWWFVAAFFVVSIVVAIGFYLGWVGGTTVAAVLMGIVAVILLGYGANRVRVDERGLSVGRTHIEWAWVADAQALDAQATKLRMGRDADARAWLMVRPWLKESVMITLNDPADPHPYWLVSSARPQEFAEAIRRRLAR